MIYIKYDDNLEYKVLNDNNMKELKIKAIPYMKTGMIDTYRELVDNKFDHESIGVLFMDIVQKKHDNYEEFNIDSCYEFTFYEKNTYYSIFPSTRDYTKEYKLPYPRTINDFINDCYRCNINLYWNTEIILKNKNLLSFISIDASVDFVNEVMMKIEKDTI